MKMLERIAKIIYNKLPGKVFEWEYLEKEDKKFFIDLAKEVIEAMREPSEAMLKAFYGDTPVEQWLGDDWHDMIDAALKEE